MNTIHIDICRADRGRYHYVAVDSAGSAFSESHPHVAAADFLADAAAHFRAAGRAVARVVTDEAECWHSQAFRQECARLGLRHDKAPSSVAERRLRK